MKRRAVDRHSLQILALSYVPLVVVQPALASGLLVLLLVGERLLGERPGRRELLSVAAIVAGVAGIAALAPAHTTHHVHGVAVIVVLALLGAAAFTPFILQLVGRPMANATMIGAGLAFAWSGLVNQFVADYVKENPRRLLSCGSLHPRHTSNVLADVEQILRLGLQMIKIHPPHQLLFPNEYLSGAKELEIIYRAAEANGGRD